MSSELPDRPEVTVDTYVETPEMHESARIRAAARIASTNVAEINLSKEEITARGVYRDEDGSDVIGEQQYAVVTFLTPAFGHVMTRGSFGFKIYSAHVTLEDAQKTAERLKAYHKELYGSSIYSILIVEMGKFCEIPTTREDLNRLIKDRRHDDESLHEMVKQYRIEQEKASLMFHERKEALVGAAKKFNAIERARQLRAEAEAAPADTEISGAGAGAGTGFDAMLGPDPSRS